MSKILYLIPVVYTFSIFANVEMEPIIYSSKQDVKESNFIDAYNVINEDEIEMTSSPQLEDLLSKQSFVTTKTSGAIGGESSIFIRGTESRHTIILIDGVRVHDPTSVDRTMNLSMIKNTDIERVEILRGSQSALYGSDAIGGVVNIITKKGKRKQKVKLQGGYAKQIESTNSFSIGENEFNLNAHYFESDFLSAAADETEKDLHVHKGFHISHRINHDKIKARTSLKYFDAHLDTDRFDFTKNKPVDDRGSFSKDGQVQINHQLDINLQEQRDMSFNISASKYKRKNKYYSVTDYERDFYEGDSIQTEIKMNETLLDGNIIYGFFQLNDSYHDDSVSRETQVINEMFYNHYQEIENYIFSYGGRLTSNTQFGDHLVYKASLERNFLEKQLKFGGSLSTAYKAPSIYQQFAPETAYGKNGNKNLAPEKSKNIEVFTEYNCTNFMSRMTYYNMEISDLIEHTGANGYVNSSTLFTKGFELENTFFTSENLSLSLNGFYYHYDKSNGSKVLRRPTRSYSSKFTYKANDKHRVMLNLLWNDERFDMQGSEVVKLSSYELIDLSYQFSRENFTLLASVNNLLDREYQLVKGYSTMGRNFSINIGLQY